MTSIHSPETRMDRLALISNDHTLADVDPELLDRVLRAARAANLMPPRQVNIEWGLDFGGEGTRVVLAKDEAQALSTHRAGLRQGWPDPGRPVHRQHTSYASHTGEWVAAPAAAVVHDVALSGLNQPEGR